MVFPRRAWFLVVVAVVAVCATLAAHAMASLAEAMYLAPSTHASPPPLVIAPPKPPRTRPDGAELVTRNMFCSTCTPLEPRATDAFTPDAILVATSIGLEARASLRTPDVLGSFGVGDDVPGVGRVVHIGWTYVELVDASGRHGRVTFAGAPPPPPPSSTTAATDPWEGRLTRVDDHTFEVDRSLVRELVSGAARPGAVRITPIPGDNGQLAGLRFSGVRAGSLPAALGMRNADTITEINGAKITSANTLLDVLAKLDQLSVVEVDGTRAGKPLGITLRLR